MHAALKLLSALKDFVTKIRKTPIDFPSKDNSAILQLISVGYILKLDNYIWDQCSSSSSSYNKVWCGPKAHQTSRKDADTYAGLSNQTRPIAPELSVLNLKWDSTGALLNCPLLHKFKITVLLYPDDFLHVRPAKSQAYNVGISHFCKTQTRPRLTFGLSPSGGGGWRRWHHYKLVRPSNTVHFLGPGTFWTRCAMRLLMNEHKHGAQHRHEVLSWILRCLA